MLKLRNNKQGFSLIELLVTIAIIGILAAVAVPAYQNYIKKAKLGVAESILRQAIRNIQLNQELGDNSTSTNIAASIKSKGEFIPAKTGNGALIIAGDVGGDNAVAKNAIAYCVSVTIKTDVYPAACAQRESGGVIKINPPSTGNNPVKQIVCKTAGVCG